MRFPVRRFVVTLAATTLVATGCGEALRNLEGVGVRMVMQDRTAAVLQDAGISLAGELDCNADVSDADVVTGSCGGTDTDGVGVASTLEGTFQQGAEEGDLCTGLLVVKRDGVTIFEDPAFNCLEE